MSPQSAATFMRISAWLTLLSGLGLSIALIPGLEDMFETFLSIVIPGSEGMSALATTEAKMILAIDGGLLASFGAFFLLISAPAIMSGDAEIKRASIYVLLIWFVVDGIGSAIAGAPLNILSNCIFLFALGAPLVWVKNPEAAQAT